LGLAEASYVCNYHSYVCNYHLSKRLHLQNNSWRPNIGPKQMAMNPTGKTMSNVRRGLSAYNGRRGFGVAKSHQMAD